MRYLQAVEMVAVSLIVVHELLSFLALVFLSCSDILLLHVPPGCGHLLLCYPLGLEPIATGERSGYSLIE